MLNVVSPEVFALLPIICFGMMAANLRLASFLYRMRFLCPWETRPPLLLFLRWLTSAIFVVTALASIGVAMIERIDGLVWLYLGAFVCGPVLRFMERRSYKEEAESLEEMRYYGTR
jgi:hypothetical protein